MTTVKTASVHIVRQYGTSGGMEKYVHSLTLALARQGQPVTVLCEHAEPLRPNSAAEGINVIELGQPVSRPRWLAQWVFSRRVARHVATTDYSNAIIHSHERTSVHQVTTFHGPPFAMRKPRLLDFLSPRIHMWTYLEKRELLADQVQQILPNSALIASYLKDLYPAAAKKIAAPAHPAVDANLINRKTEPRGLTIGFMGREWRRKGLDIACQIVERTRQKLPDVKFIVAGCDVEQIAPMFKHWPADSYQLLGWQDSTKPFLHQIDLLLHPARAEPFGMVIAEANAAGTPVLVSDKCGIAPLIGPQQGQVCPMDGDNPDITVWADASAALLQSQQKVAPLNLSWDNLAIQHCELYQKLLNP